MPERADDGARKRGWLGLSYTAYQHVTGVLGGLALAAVLSHFVDIDWRGLLAHLVTYWDEYARPAVKWVLDILIVIPLRWLFG